MHYYIDGESQGCAMNSAKNCRFDDRGGIKNACLRHIDHLAAKHIKTITRASLIDGSENLVGVMTCIEQQCTQRRLTGMEQDIVCRSFIRVLRLM